MGLKAGCGGGGGGADSSSAILSLISLISLACCVRSSWSSVFSCSSSLKIGLRSLAILVAIYSAFIFCISLIDFLVFSGSRPSCRDVRIPLATGAIISLNPLVIIRSRFVTLLSPYSGEVARDATLDAARETNADPEDSDTGREGKPSAPSLGRSSLGLDLDLDLERPSAPSLFRIGLGLERDLERDPAREDPSLFVLFLLTKFFKSPILFFVAIFKKRGCVTTLDFLGAKGACSVQLSLLSQ